MPLCKRAGRASAAPSPGRAPARHLTRSPAHKGAAGHEWGPSLHLFTAVVSGLPIGAFGLLCDRRLGMHLSLGLLSCQLAAGLSPFGFLRGGRLALHLLLRILRRRRNVSTRTVHSACWRMLIGISAHA